MNHMPKEQMDAGRPRSAEQQVLLCVKEHNDEEIEKVIHAILEVERVNSNGKSVEFEGHMARNIQKYLAEYFDGDSCVVSASFGGMRFIIIRDEDGIIKLILDEKYPKEVIKQAKESGIGTMDTDVAEAIIKQFKRERDKSVTFRIGEDSAAERERVAQTVLSIEREFVSSADERIVRYEVGLALDDFFEGRKGTGFEGCGGWNRYEIKPDGSIALSKYHSTDKCIKKAKELGFDTF